MLHTNSKLATTKLAFKWVFEVKNHPKIKLESIQILHNNTLKNVEISQMEYDKFYWDYATGTEKIIMNCSVKKKPAKLILLLDKFQNTLFIEADNADMENTIVKYVF
jgi:hypothetical protein